MESQGVVAINFVNRYPPINLALWSGIPRVPVGVPSVGNTGGQVAITSGGPHPGHIEVGVVTVASEVAQNRLNAFLRSRMMDEFRLKTAQNSCVLLHGKTVLRFPGIQVAEGLLYQLVRDFTES